ncbi:hypothetical protein [Vogesella sp. LIG4]|uniref:hypothetical protein n=1 Tax=Vogesella sp. LIG4 TaxID=1192162 RepID=UPI00081FDA3F|nr:hypothetical protein [Vogesella sp. LIG4]SCK24836.1 hypothetical protein PSELUDRAFT_2931 [Vogesella sp. LIG4]
MNAAKRLTKMLDSGESNSQLEVLKMLAIALHHKQAFDLALLYSIDYPYFQLALQLLDDWRLGQHLATRSKLMERLFGMHPDMLVPTALPAASQLQTTRSAPLPRAASSGVPRRNSKQPALTPAVKL